VLALLRGSRAGLPSSDEPAMQAESLAEFELLVMLAAMRLGPDRAYTVSIVDDIGRRTGRSVRRANVFTALRRLEERGLVATRLGEPRPERGGRPPRLVAVEPAGLDALRATTSAIRAMVGELGPILGESR
jgi:DNA-binding PadR family transcriptional regulator